MTDTKEPDKSKNSADSKSENSPDGKSENSADSKSENSADSKSESSADSKTESSVEQQPNYEFDGKNYVYKDPTTNVTYKFDQEKNDWVVKEKEEESNTSDVKEKTSNPAEPSAQGVFGFENDTHTYTDPNDGSAYFWDKEKNAWFPKLDDDFMARYQMSYGFVEPEDAQSKPTQPPPPTQPPNKVDKEQKKQEAKRKAQEPPTWFEVDEAHNTAIYVSGLPLDITMDELTELCAKCGLIARDEKGKNRIKLYRDSNGEPKGDALCIYIKVESVDLALKILNKWPMRGKTLSVSRAQFQMKGTYDPALKPKRKKKDKDRQRKIQEKLLDWRPDRLRGEPQKCERVVIVKNLFSPEDFDNEVSLLLEYQQDIRSECLKCGDVRKVVIYDRHPEGVAQVTFREPSEAQACIQLLNGRWFSQRKISAAIWDGKTRYKVHETDAEIEARIAKWDKYLENEEEENKDGKKPDRSNDTKKSVKGSSSGAGSDESSVGKTEPSVGKSNDPKCVKTPESPESSDSSEDSE